MDGILTKFQQIASNEGITIGAMERSIGASKGVLSRAIANGTDIQAKWLISLAQKYPQYSAEWLIRGNGEMFLGEEKPVSLSSGINGDNNKNNSVNDTDTLNRLLGLVETKDRQIEEKDRQIDALLGIIKGKQ